MADWAVRMKRDRRNETGVSLILILLPSKVHTGNGFGEIENYKMLMNHIESVCTDYDRRCIFGACNSETQKRLDVVVW